MTFKEPFQPHPLGESVLTLKSYSFLFLFLSMNIPLSFSEQILDKNCRCYTKSWLLFHDLLFPSSRKQPKPTDTMKNVGLQSLKTLLHCWHQEACWHSVIQVLQGSLPTECHVNSSISSGSHLDPSPFLCVICKSHLQKASMTGFMALCKMQFILKWLQNQQTSCSLTETKGGTKRAMCFCFLYFTDKNLSRKKGNELHPAGPYGLRYC